MLPSSSRSITRSISHAQPIGLSSSSDSHTIPNSRSSRRHPRSCACSDPRIRAAARSPSAARRSPAGTAGIPPVARACAAVYCRLPTDFQLIENIRVSRLSGSAAGRIRTGRASKADLWACLLPGPRRRSSRRARGEHQVVEHRRRQPRLQQARGRGPAGADIRGRRTGATPRARRAGRPSPPACGWSSRTSWRAAPRRARARPPCPRSCAARESSARRERVHVHEHLERRLRRASLGGRGGPRPDRPAPQRRQGAGRALGHAREAIAVARGLPGEHDRPAGREHARELPNARSRSGMWCSTAWPNTRSKLASANGSCSASAGLVFTLRPSPLAFACSVLSMPGEMSLHVACPISPARSMFSVK